jgi:serine/threonine-protein kinase
MTSLHQRGRYAVALFFAAAVAHLVAAPASAHAADKYAAIAYSPSTGAFGYSYNFATRTSAEKVALAECKGDDAQVLVWARNGWCCLAVGDDNAYGYSWADNEDYAKKLALSECKKQADNCKIVVAVSSDGQVEK